MNREGYVILSTDRSQEGKIYDQEPYFQNGLEGLQFEVRQVNSLRAPSLGKMTMILSRPMIDDQGQSIGVLAAHVNMSELNSMMHLSSEVIEEPVLAVEFHLVAPAALVDAKVIDREHPYILVASSTRGQEGKYVYSQGIASAVREQGPGTVGGSGSGLYENHRGVSVVGVYRWLPELDLILLTEQDAGLVTQESRISILISVGLAMGALLLAGIIALIVTRSITGPLTRLAEDATRIASGDLQHTASVERDDEIGMLARAFNRMTARLGDLISSLEQRVAERTQDLEHHSRYLAAASEVGGVLGTTLDPQQLFQEVVTSMHKAFDFQYVGLFMLDEPSDDLPDEGNQRAILRASAGKVANKQQDRSGQILTLPIDETSVIGEAVLNGEARVLQEGRGGEVDPIGGEDVDGASIREAGLSQANHGWHVALPLRARDEVLGVLWIYALDEGKEPFDADIINVLQMVADEIAVALENAKLFEQSEKALEAAQRAYGELVDEAWIERFRKRQEWGYRYIAGLGSDSDSDMVRKSVELDGAVEDEEAVSKAPAVIPAEGSWRPEMVQAARQGEPVRVGADSEALTSLALPIKSHGQVIGVLNLRSDDNPISSDQISLLEDITNRLGLALENARLLDDSRQRAAREQLTANLAARMREPLDVDSVLRTAARELYEGLGLSKVRVRLMAPQLESEQSGDPGLSVSDKVAEEVVDYRYSDVSNATFTEGFVIPNKGEE